MFSYELFKTHTHFDIYASVQRESTSPMPAVKVKPAPPEWKKIRSIDLINTLR